MPLLLPPSIPGPVEKAVETRARLRSVAIRLSSTTCRCHAPNKFPRSPRRPHFPRSHFPRRIEIGRAIWIPRGERQREKERERYVSAAGTTPRCRALTGSPIDNYLSGGLINSVPTRSPRDKITAARSAERIEGKEDGYTCG